MRDSLVVLRVHCKWSPGFALRPVINTPLSICGARVNGKKPLECIPVDFSDNFFGAFNDFARETWKRDGKYVGTLTIPGYPDL